VKAIKLASPQIQEVVKDLQALRGIAQISAVTIAAELGNISSKYRSCNRRFRVVALLSSVRCIQ